MRNKECTRSFKDVEGSGAEMGGERRRAGPGILTTSFRYKCNLGAREAVLADWQVYPLVQNSEKALGILEWMLPRAETFFSFAMQFRLCDPHS